MHTHDRTGRKALFVNADSTTRVDGWTTEESAPLLAYLYAQARRNELTCRHRWTVGDLLIWDNRATQHSAVGDAAAGEERTLHRVTVAGAVPRRRPAPPTRAGDSFPGPAGRTRRGGRSVVCGSHVRRSTRFA